MGTVGAAGLGYSDLIVGGANAGDRGCRMAWAAAAAQMTGKSSCSHGGELAGPVPGLAVSWGGPRRRSGAESGRRAVGGAIRLVGPGPDGPQGPGLQEGGGPGLGPGDLLRGAAVDLQGADHGVDSDDLGATKGGDEPGFQVQGTVFFVLSQAAILAWRIGQRQGQARRNAGKEKTGNLDQLIEGSAWGGESAAGMVVILVVR